MTIRDIIKLVEIISQKENLGLNIDKNIFKEFEFQMKSFNSVFSIGIDFIHEFFRLNKNLLPQSISKKIFSFVNSNNKLKQFGIRLAN